MRPIWTWTACTRRARRCAGCWPRSRTLPSSPARWASVPTSSSPRWPRTPRSQPASWCSGARRPARASPRRRRACCRASGRRPPRASASSGLDTLAAVASAPTEVLVERFGANLGRALQRRARFEHEGEVEAVRRVVSESRERTFDRDLDDPVRQREELARMAQELCASLAAHGRSGRTIAIKVRLDDFTTVTRAHTVPEPTCDVGLVSSVALRLLEDYAPAALGAPVGCARRRTGGDASRPAPAPRPAPDTGGRGSASACARQGRWRRCRRLGFQRADRERGRYPARLRAQRVGAAAAADHGHERNRAALGRVVPGAAAARLRGDRLRPPRRGREQPSGGADHDRRDGRAMRSACSTRWRSTRPT